MKTVSDSQLAQLSAYIDNDLAPAERAALEAQLAQDPALRNELAELQSTVLLLRELPAVVAPRTWTLDPAVYGKPRRVFSWMRWAASVGGFVLIIAVGLGIFSSSVRDRLDEASWSSAPSNAAATTGSSQAQQPLQLTVVADLPTSDAGLAAGGSQLEQATATQLRPQATASPQPYGTPLPPVAAATFVPRATAAPPATTAPPVGGVPPFQPAQTSAPPALTPSRQQPAATAPGAPTFQPPPAAATSAPALAATDQPQTEERAAATSSPGDPDAETPAQAAPSEGFNSTSQPITNTIPLPAFDTTRPDGPDSSGQPTDLAGGVPGPSAKPQPADDQTVVGQPSRYRGYGRLVLLLGLAGVVFAAVFLGWRRISGRGAGK